MTDIFFLVIAAVVSGADDWKHIELFGRSQFEWLQRFGSFKNGIPSHDTLGRFFARLDPEEFSRCFIDWAQQICHLTQGEVIAIDGKRLRGSYDKSSGKAAIHMVSAFATSNNLVLGQTACAEKSNEITAIPELLNLIAIEKSVVTIDAMGCQKDIAKKVIDKKADYILAVKGNQKELFEQVEKVFQITGLDSEDTSIDAGHGRVETRKCSVIKNLEFLDDCEGWKCLKSVVKVTSEVFIKAENKHRTETRYYISSLAKPAIEMNKKIRSHWSVENNLHWMLDVCFREDSSRRRKGYSAQNFNLISKVALRLLSRGESNPNKISKKGKRATAGWNADFREKIMQI